MCGLSRRSPLDPVASWSDLIDAERTFDNSAEEWVFRGQPSTPDPLATTLETVCKDFDIDAQDIPRLEADLLIDFSRRYHLFEGRLPPAKGDTLEWLSLMRHHGAPTRLLDFTFSLFIATYFALEEAKTDSSVWAVSKTWLANQALKIVGIDLLKTFATTRSGPSFRTIFWESKPPLRFVCPISPRRLNERLSIQQGMFLAPGDVTATFCENLASLEDSQDKVRKVVIKAESRTELLRKLHSAGINRSVLFPGLDGFAQSLRTKIVILSKLLERERTGARLPLPIDPAKM